MLNAKNVERDSNFELLRFALSEHHFAFCRPILILRQKAAFSE